MISHNFEIILDFTEDWYKVTGAQYDARDDDDIMDQIFDLGAKEVCINHCCWAKFDFSEGDDIEALKKKISDIITP